MSDCKFDDGPYGSNANGQTVCYKTQTNNLLGNQNDFDSCAPQLVQVRPSIFKRNVDLNEFRKIFYHQMLSSVLLKSQYVSIVRPIYNSIV